MSVTVQDRSNIERPTEVKTTPTYELYTFVDEAKTNHFYLIPTKFAQKKPQKSKKNLVYRANVIVPLEIGYAGAAPFDGVVCISTDDQFQTNTPLKNDCATWHVTSNQGYLHDNSVTRYIFASEGLTYVSYEARAEYDAQWTTIDARSEDDIRTALRAALSAKFGNRSDGGTAPARVGRPFVAVHQILVLPAFPLFSMGDPVEKRPKSTPKSNDPNAAGDAAAGDAAAGADGDDKNKARRKDGADEEAKRKRLAARRFNPQPVGSAVASAISVLVPSLEAKEAVAAAIDAAAAAAGGADRKRTAAAAALAANVAAKRVKRNDGTPGVGGVPADGKKDDAGAPLQPSLPAPSATVLLPAPASAPFSGAFRMPHTIGLLAPAGAADGEINQLKMRYTAVSGQSTDAGAVAVPPPGAIPTPVAAPLPTAPGYHPHSFPLAPTVVGAPNGTGPITAAAALPHPSVPRPGVASLVPSVVPPPVKR